MGITDLLKTTKAKGTALVGGTSILAIAFNMLIQRVDHIEKSIEKKEAEIMRNVDLKHYQVLQVMEIKTTNIENRVKEANETLIRIEERLYRLSKKDLYSTVNKDESNSTN